MSDYRSIYEEIDRSKELAPIPLENINDQIIPGTFVRILGPSLSGCSKRIGEVAEVADVSDKAVYTVPPEDPEHGLAFERDFVLPVPRPESLTNDPSLVTGVGYAQLVKALRLARRHLRKSTEIDDLGCDEKSVAQRDADIETIDTVIKHHPMELGR